MSGVQQAISDGAALVAIHDSARPLVTAEDTSRCLLDALQVSCCATVEVAAPVGHIQLQVCMCGIERMLEQVERMSCAVLDDRWAPRCWAWR